MAEFLPIFAFIAIISATLSLMLVPAVEKLAGAAPMAALGQQIHDFSRLDFYEFRNVLRQRTKELRRPGFFLLPITQALNDSKTHDEEGTLASRSEIFSRLSELRREATTEQIPYSQQSEQDLLKFLLLHPSVTHPHLFLLENGNLRTIWRNGDGEQVGLQFRGGELIQYVIFVRRAGSQLISRSAGRDLLSSIERLLEAHDVDKLMLAASAA